jgi:nucleoside-diphosphate-sugar epimerase
MILVTGASGFLGRCLVQYLSAQGSSPIRALYRNTKPDKDLQNLPNVSWQSCDLLDVFEVEEAMQGVTEVYHCAAMVSFLPKHRDEMLHSNVASTANIVNEALIQNIRKMVYVSSVAALGRNSEGNEITEEVEWEESNHNSAYGISKYMAEMEVWRGIGEGLNIVIINPGIILGAGNWDEGSARLMKVADNEFPFYTEGINGWVDVADVAKVMHLLMQSDITAERFIMSMGNYGYKEVFTMMANMLGRKPPRIKANSIMTSLTWRWGAAMQLLFGTTPLITKETARNAHNKSIYNNEKLLKAMPHFTYTPIEVSIENMASVFRPL